MSTTFTLLRTELTLLRRDTTALVTAIVLPLGIGAFWALGPPPFGETLGALIVLQVVLLLGFTLHTVGVMSLASRREQLVLQRWRTSQASDGSVLAGTIGVPAALVVVQAAVLTAITGGIAGAAPSNLAVLGLGVLSGVAVIGALTVLVGAFTRSAEHAMITTFPVITALVGATMYALLSGGGPTDPLVAAIPGGATAQLLLLGWDGLPEGLTWGAALTPNLIGTAVAATVASAAAIRWFRWGPRD